LTGTFGDSSHGGPSFRYGGGYIATVKQRNANTFISMSRAAGANVDNGVGVAGGRFTWGPVSLGAIEYYNQDTINIAYAEGQIGHRFDFGVDAILALQYADQRSTGLNLASGGNYFATNQFGARLDAGYGTGIFPVAYSVVNPNYFMQNPWSANPIYTNAVTLGFQRAGENALMVGGSYVFTPIGLSGIAASVYYYQGWTGASAGPPTVENEWDFTLDWRPDFKPLSGLWFRARYAHSSINQNNMISTTDEVRITLNYGLKLY
jgi:outer membrane OprD family porin